MSQYVKESSAWVREGGSVPDSLLRTKKELKGAQISEKGARKFPRSWSGTYVCVCVCVGTKPYIIR